MFIPSHIASGYLLGRILKCSSWTVYPFIPILLFASILPDADGIFSSTVAGHHSVLHTPIFWIIIFAGMIVIQKWKKIEILKPISLGLFLGTQIHLITDWLTARTVGIQWFYPFNQTDYYLYQIRPEEGQVTVWEMIQNPYFSFYMENAVLFWAEIGVTFIALSLTLSNILRNKISNK
jgi:membrane-bound metal-dependent hydrolase YbcI (DUF457 family)